VDYATSLGAEGVGPQALATLRAVPAMTFAEGMAGPDIIAGMNKGKYPPGYAAAILDGRFFVETPEAALAAGRVKDVPIIVGANSLDLGIGPAGSKDDLWATFGPLADEARALYDPDGTAELSAIAQPVLGQRTLIEPARHMADVLARLGRPVWLYRFSYVWESQRDKMAGTLHGYEIPFVMAIPEALVGPEATTDADREIATLTSAYWTTFAKTLNPNGDGRPDWPRHDPESADVFNFTAEATGLMADPIGPKLDLVERSRLRN
jgi:para-nitrobenzyl esterase